MEVAKTLSYLASGHIAFQEAEDVLDKEIDHMRTKRIPPSLFFFVSMVKWFKFDHTSIINPPKT